MNIGQFIKLLVPPLFVKIYRTLHNGKNNNPPEPGIHFSGDYQSWGEAVANSTGYDAEIILERTKTALLKVKNGEAIYERDSFLFNSIHYSWPLLAGLMWVAASSGGRLNVLDFGGSLGSTYFQNRCFLTTLPELRWNIVEQPGYVKVGKSLFENEHLRFYLDIESCLAGTEPNVILLSGVLQYLENPYALLRKVLGCGIKHIIIDRTAFWNADNDRLCVQRIPSNLYDASYPAWILSLSKFRAALSTSRIVAEFPGFENGGDYGCEFRGFIILARDDA